MPPDALELYLALLRKFLRLRRDQSEAIVDEIRDHLTERLEELTHQGRGREEAVRLALDEFGDAAALALHFTQLVRQRRRRRLMRYTLGGVGILSVVLLLAAAFWPDNSRLGAPVNTAHAQQPQDEGAAAPPKETDPAIVEVETKLEKRLNPDDVAFDEMPLRECLQRLSQLLEVDILFAQRDGIEDRAPVTLRLKHAKIKARTALELLLEQSQQEVDYTIRDGVVYIVNASRAGTIHVYNCRDLLAGMPGMAGGAMGGLGPQLGVGGPGGFGLGVAEPGPMGGGGGFGQGVGAQSSAGAALIQVITTMIEADSWSTRGGCYTVEEFNGLLVIKNRPSVHAKIAELLAMMRKSHAEQGAPQGPNAAAGGFGLPGFGGIGPAPQGGEGFGVPAIAPPAGAAPAPNGAAVPAVVPGNPAPVPLVPAPGAPEPQLAPLAPAAPAATAPGRAPAIQPPATAPKATTPKAPAPTVPLVPAPVEEPPLER